jgi:hypothetical protein
VVRPTAISGERNVIDDTWFKKFVVLPQGGSRDLCDFYRHLTRVPELTTGEICSI